MFLKSLLRLNSLTIFIDSWKNIQEYAKQFKMIVAINIFMW